MIQQPNNIEANQNSGLNMNDLDFEFMTKGDQIVETQDIAGRMQQNLTPEELQEMAELAPYAEKFMLLYIKSETGQLPSEQDANRLLAEMSQGMTPTNGQGVPPEQGSGAMVPQDMQTKRKVPSRPVEGQMPQNAPEMMSGGGEVTKFDPDGESYDQETYKKIGSPKYFDERTQEMHGPSASPMSELIKNKIFTEDDIKKYNLPMEGSLLLKGMNYETTPLELEAVKGKYQYKKVPTPLGDRYVAFPIDKKMAIGGVAAGPAGVVNQPGADNSGVADDVPAESDGFVINAAAVRHAGLRDINDMIQGAIEYAKKQGIELDFGKTPVDAEQILVSNGEVVIPDVIAKIIGYDKLEKINNRGDKETEKKIAEQEQQPQQQAPAMQPQQPVMQAAKGGQMKDLFPAESAIALEELEEVRKSKEPDRELAVRVYEALTVPETGVFEDPFIRTDFISEEGSTAYGPVQITKGLMENPRYSDIDDPYESIARQRLINQSEKFVRFGNRDWEKLLESGEITQKEADEAAALYEYGKSGDYVRDDRDKEDYKRYAVSIINRKLKDLEKKGFKDKEKLEKFLKEWNPKASKKYIKEFFDTFEKNLDN